MQGGVTGLKLNHDKFFEISGTLKTIIHFVQCVFIVVVTLLVFHSICLVQKCVMSLTRKATERKDAEKWKEIRSAYRILSRKCQETRPLRRTWCKLEDNIKVYLNRHPLSNDGLDSVASESYLLKKWSMVMSLQINR